MLEQILREINNWFMVKIYPGDYAVENGSIALPFLQPGQYYRVVGSVFNDGLHRYGPDSPPLEDETFSGAIWALAIPKSVIDLGEEISAWVVKYKDTVESPYTSESFGGYTYSKSGGAGDSGNSSGWQWAFREKLRPYRKLGGIV